MHDFKFDPFENQIVATACDDGKVRFFRIPFDGLKDDFLVPESVIGAHYDRTTIILFHPTIKNMLLSSSPGRGSAEIKIWDTKDSSCLLTIPQTDVVLSCCFDLLGTNVVSLGKDQKLSIFDLKTGDLVKETKSHIGGKSARVFWLKGEKSLGSVGFSSGSQRELIVYNDFQNPVSSILDTSPSLLIPFYDIDTSVLLLIGRGESMVIYYEIVDEAAVYLNRYQINSGITTAFACLSKTSVNVQEVEIIKGYRLSQTSIDTVSVSVPRIKKEYFQDDVFPDTIDYQASSITINDWMKNEKVGLKYKSMRPDNMTKGIFEFISFGSTIGRK
jgi:coronin-7